MSSLSSSSLLLVSDFCKSSKPAKVLIPIQILTSWTRTLSFTRKSDWTRAVNDSTSVCLVPLNVLLSLSLTEGSFAVLTHGSNKNNSKVVVRLYLLEEEQNQQHEENGKTDDDDPTVNVTALVAPIVAQNLGLSIMIMNDPHKNNSNQRKQECWMEAMDNSKSLQLAKHVVLKPLGYPLPWPQFTNHDDDEDCWIFPPCHTLIQKSHLLGIYETKKDRVYYYEILDVNCDHDKKEDEETQRNKYHHKDQKENLCFVCLTNQSTTFGLNNDPISNCCFVRRLPPLLSQQQFFKSFTATGTADSTNNHALLPTTKKHPKKTMTMTMMMIPPHPNLQELMQALCQPPVQSQNPSELIFNVIGTDSDHHVRVAVETAAKQVGLECWSLRGLAAFGHHYSTLVAKRRSNNNNNTPMIRTGSLVDQLTGLQAALLEIRQKRMEPCVLHLYDFDAELSTFDEPLRQDQEERFWAKWIESLSAAAATLDMDTDSFHSSSSNHRQKYTSPLTIVISTALPLKPGPLLEKLVFPSITLKTPDFEYIQYLWNKNRRHCDRDDNDKNDNTNGNDNELDESIMELLHGRPAREIEWLCQQCTNTPTTLDHDDMDNDTFGYKKQLEKLCQKLDKERRKKSSATVANVHWDDVGGLAHVRREIMDAIELPLKHPHLFPKTGGRSGILLYGPPGTGKTLVARAVATECGLPFLSVKGPELLGSYVGESEANVRNIFKSARDAAAKNNPITASILFFDELDSLAPHRGGVGDGGGVMERVVATLFGELDCDVSAAAEDEGRVFVMGATNRPDLLDPSLLRPGRLDRLVYLGIPDNDNERARVLAAQLHKLKLEGDPLDLAKVVVGSLPPRLTGADMSTIASGALLLAVERLCKLADEEKRSAEDHDNNVVMTIDLILEGWDETKRTPLVRLDDLLEASKNVVPSVSQSDLDRYERLRDEYKSTDNVPI